MKLSTRRFIFYSLVLIFILITPPTVLYAVGYSFDWQNLSIKQTGALYLKSKPSSAKIFINGKNNKTTPRLISHLLPGFYQVKISAENFHPWQKTLEIKPGLVTEARNIFLFPKNPVLELVAENASSSIEVIQNNKNLIGANSIPPQVTTSTAAGWLLKNENIFYLEKDTLFLWRTDLSGSIKEQLASDSLSTQQNYEIKTLSGNRFLALGQDGQLFYLQKGDKTWQKISDKTNFADFSSDEKKILWIKENELWVKWLEDFLVQPYRQKNEQELIIRFSSPIKTAVFYPNDEYLTFVVENQIKVTELDNRDLRNIVDLIDSQDKNISIFLNSSNRYLYLKQNNNLFRLVLNN